MDLNSARSSGFAPNAISYTEMHSYFTLMNMFPEEWEMDLIRLLDKVAMQHFSKELNKKTSN